MTLPAVAAELRNPHLVSLLRQLPLFEGFDAVALHDLACAVREKHYAKGGIVFQKGDAPTGLFLVISGLIKEACQNSTGGERIIRLVEARQSFGETALCLDLPHPTFAAALEDTFLLHLNKTAFTLLLARRADFASRMTMLMSGRICTLMDDVESISVQRDVQRVASYLLERRPVATDLAPSIRLPAAKHVVASLLDMAPETLSRNLRELAKKGLIKVRGNQVDLLDQESLKDYPGGLSRPAMVCGHYQKEALR